MRRTALVGGCIAGAVASGPVVLLGVAPEAAGALGATPVSVRMGALVWGIGVGVGSLVATRLDPRGTLATLAPSAGAAGLGHLVTAGAGGLGTLHLALLLGGMAAGPVAIGTRASIGGDRRRLAEHDAAALVALGAVLLAAVAARAGLAVTWRGALMVPATAMLVTAAGALVPLLSDRRADAVPASSRPRRLGEAVRQVTTVRSAGPLLGAAAAFGALGLPLVDAFHHLLGDRWLSGAAEQQRLLGVLALAAAAGVLAAGHRDGAGAGRALRLSSDLAFAAGACFALAAGLDLYAPAVLLLAAGAAALGAARNLLDATLLTLVPAPVRREALALAVGTSVGGAALGFIVAQIVADRSRWTWAFAALGLAAALSAARISRAVDAAEADERAQAAPAPVATRRSARALLRCSGIDFSYGQVQVLFGVDLTVRPGETVALLGTNGAGKSTLLRVISGICTPQAGTVHLDGQDITFTDATRRVPLGISQVPGGRAVFGPLSVAENLRLYGYSLGRDRRRVEMGIEAAFGAFPRLAERRDQRASTLSGGEQQMLALSKALIVPPRVLLIDELSLGLAPKVVGELLVIVRRIAAEGTAVVLVEQSVNVALGLVEHAYFMEKGQIRFDGRAADLVARPDLLRSVFLAGAAKGLAG